MALRGQRPKPPELKLVTGNPGRRHVNGGDSVLKEVPEVEMRETPLDPPKKLTKYQASLWKRFIDTAWWLSEHDISKAYMWVCLQAEHDKAPGKMIAARIAQLRVLGSELGFDPSERARMGIARGKKKDPVDGYFD